MAFFGRKNRSATGVVVEEVEEEIFIDLADRSPRSGLLWKDLMLFSEILDSGADMNEPRRVVYVMHFDLKRTADKARTRGRSRGYLSTVVKAPEGSDHRWDVIYEREEVLDLTVLIAADDFFKSVAEELGGTLEGLEIPE